MYSDRQGPYEGDRYSNKRTVRGRDLDWTENRGGQEPHPTPNRWEREQQLQGLQDQRRGKPFPPDPPPPQPRGRHPDPKPGAKRARSTAGSCYAQPTWPQHLVRGEHGQHSIQWNKELQERACTFCGVIVPAGITCADPCPSNPKK